MCHKNMNNCKRGKKILIGPNFVSLKSWAGNLAETIGESITVSVYGSSCNGLLFGLILSSFLSQSTPWNVSLPALGMPLNRKRK